MTFLLYSLAVLICAVVGLIAIVRVRQVEGDRAKGRGRLLKALTDAGMLKKVKE